MTFFWNLDFEKEAAGTIFYKNHQGKGSKNNIKNMYIKRMPYVVHVTEIL